MIEVRRYQPGDALLVDAMEKEFNLADQDIIMQQESVIAHTVVDGDKHLAIIAIHCIWKGVFDVWSLFSEEVKSTPKLTGKMARAFLTHYQRQHGIRRYQMTVRTDLKCGERWAEFLGFKKEGIMQKFGPDGADHALYARIYS